MTPLDNLLWNYVKYEIYVETLTDMMGELKQTISGPVARALENTFFFYY
jgi:hypothetical protein